MGEVLGPQMVMDWGLTSVGGKCQKWANCHTHFARKLVVLTKLIRKKSALALTFQQELLTELVRQGLLELGM